MCHLFFLLQKKNKQNFKIIINKYSKKSFTLSDNKKMISSEEIPDKQVFQYKLDHSIVLHVFKNKKFVFVAPEPLKDITVRSFMDASTLIKGRISFPYADWERVSTKDNYWTGWKYEQHINKLNILNQDPPMELTEPDKNQSQKNSQTNVNVFSEDITSVIEIPVNPFTIPPENWDSVLISKWIQYQTLSDEVDGVLEIPLKKITHFRRYGMNFRFEFLCIWDCNGKEAYTWLKYVDLIRISNYAQYLKRYWNILVEKDKHWDQIEEVQSDIELDEIDIIIPEAVEENNNNTENRKSKKKFKKEDVVRPLKKVQQEEKSKQEQEQEQDDDDSEDFDDVKSLTNKLDDGNSNNQEIEECQDDIRFSKSATGSLPIYKVKKFPTVELSKHSRV